MKERKAIARRATTTITAMSSSQTRLPIVDWFMS